MTAQKFPDATAVVVEWLRSSAAGTAVAGRIYNRSPNPVAYPFLRVTRTGGTPDGALDFDQPRVQVDVRGDLEQDMTVGDLALIVVAAVPDLAGNRLSGAAWVVGPYVTVGPVDQRDGETGQPGWLLEVGFDLHRKAG